MTMPDRLAVSFEDLYIVHYSGNLKMWDRDLISDETDEAFAKRLMRDCSEESCRLWLERAGTPAEYADYNVQLVGGDMLPLGQDSPSVHPILQHGVSHALMVAQKAAVQWR